MCFVNWRFRSFVQFPCIYIQGDISLLTKRNERSITNLANFLLSENFKPKSKTLSERGTFLLIIHVHVICGSCFFTLCDKQLYFNLDRLFFFGGGGGGQRLFCPPTKLLGVASPLLLHLCNTVFRYANVRVIFPHFLGKIK